MALLTTGGSPDHWWLTSPYLHSVTVALTVTESESHCSSRAGPVSAGFRVLLRFPSHRAQWPVGICSVCERTLTPKPYTLTVSISQSTSPLATESPSALRHLAMLPCDTRREKTREGRRRTASRFEVTVLKAKGKGKQPNTTASRFVMQPLNRKGRKREATASSQPLCNVSLGHGMKEWRRKDDQTARKEGAVARR